MLKKLIKNKRASEVIQNLIVIAIMGALAITAISGISNALKQKNQDVVSKIESEVGWGQESQSQ